MSGGLPGSEGRIGRAERVWLVVVARTEAVTLLLLLAAVPFRHLLHHPEYVAVLGPLHGLVFTLYVASLAQVAFGGTLSTRSAVRMFLFGILPCGGFFVADRLRRDALTPRW